ncbi:MAG: bifunctional 2-C-methyl-D-erythritol 4-phosphate cytidylyltransferase/2-C-methyl-D-erythritol 2,4-cyclodiphosphate synthase [Rhodospirillales bacterium]|nr:bifunctional 2-C-methyl-D-erythritol 4-phosphate cytidylyltransferase/2-C-methyl-D-erythritol 2,4-cyclodiphosphate synthase [Rhodospirillales bacterium]
MVTTAALIVAAGRGHRVGGPLPKQYRSLAGGTVLGHSVRRFATHPRVGTVRVVINPADRQLYDGALLENGGAEAGALLAPVAGGETRQESVRNGLESLADAPPDLVLIHDGARPLVSDAVIDGALDALAGHDGALPALAVSDSLKRAAPGSALVAGAVPREGLWRAQTPQGFRYPAILDAHRAAAGAALTDDAAVAERAWLSVALTAGDEDNLKITTEQDFARAERIMAAQGESAVSPAIALETRVGMGFDVHRFGPGDHLMLGGVAVPHDRGVVSHSDGDVVLHAIVDAVLGAMAAGDIGSHFPPSDDTWRDADSAHFVNHTLAMLRKRGGHLSHVDVTVICQRPRIGPHRQAILARLAEVLGLAPARISLKATTTERLGFTGRGEGIAAQAVATVRLPAGGGDDG